MQYSAAPPFGPDEYRRRLEGLWAKMDAEGLAVAVLMQAADLIYFTGLGLHAQLVVAPQREPVLLVQVNVDRARAEGWVTDVRPSLGFKTLREAVREVAPAGPVGLELDVTPVTYFQRIREVLGPREYRDISPAILALRAVKSEAELTVLRQAAVISQAGFAEARKRMIPGMTEMELQLRMEMVEKEQGAELVARVRARYGTMAWGICAAGPNSAEVSGYWMTCTGAGPSAAQPYASSRRPLAKGDLVAIDRNVTLHGYNVDEARTMAVGEPDPTAAGYWGALGRIMDATLAAVRPGLPVAGVYRAAAAQAEAEGVLDRFMTLATYNIEYVGHAVGLEGDELPLLTPRAEGNLVPGMVLALEPKVIIPGECGLTLEDTVAVTPDGVEVITRTPRHWFSL